MTLLDGVSYSVGLLVTEKPIVEERSNSLLYWKMKIAKNATLALFARNMSCLYRCFQSQGF